MGQPTTGNYSTRDVEDFLAHYGVKGMKWGVRRSEGSSGSSSKPPASEDFQKVTGHKQTIKSGGTKALSNRELQEVVTRMNLEEQYSTLKGKEAQRSKGNVFLKNTMKTSDTLNKVIAVVNSPAGKLARKALLGV